MKIKKLLEELVYNQQQIMRMLTTLNGKVSAQQEYIRSANTVAMDCRTMISYARESVERIERRIEEIETKPQETLHPVTKEEEYVEVAVDESKSVVDCSGTSVEDAKRIVGDKYLYVGTDRPIIGAFYYDPYRRELVKATRGFESVECHIFKKVSEEV